MIILSNSLVLSEAEEAFPDGTPWIGWHNLVTTANITASNADDEFPVTNLANPATHLKWAISATEETSEYLTIVTNYSDDIDYVGIAKHNFGSGAITISIDGVVGDGEPSDAVISLLHFEGGNSPDTFTDSAPTPHTWLAVGNATISAADMKFGDASGLFDGTGDYLTGDSSSDFAFGTGDFTIDFWVKLNATGINQNLYDSRPTGVQGFYPTIYISNANVLRFFTNSANQILSATALTTGTWYHVAVSRRSGVTRMYLNGAQTGSNYTDTNTYLNGTSRPAIGTEGFSPGSNSLNGRMDELRIMDTAAYAGGDSPDAFTVATAAYTPWEELVQETMPADDTPIIARFTPQALSQVRIRMQLNFTSPQAAVVYVGKLLVLERSITIGRGHVPINYGRRTTIVNGMSESGNFLGRIVLGEFRESKAEFEWFTPDFYRSDIDEFLEAAQEFPFFWAWHPETHPNEVGYVWLTNNAEPEVDPVTQRIALELQMRGVA